MLKALKKWWKYATAKFSSSLEGNADPKIQLEQAINEAKENHSKLKEQAASVIANQKSTEMRLNRSLEELEKVSANAKQAILMADDAAKSGDSAKATEYTQAAESFAHRLIGLEHEVDGLKELAIQSAEASSQATAMIQQNSVTLQAKLSERQKLLSQLDQATMQEKMNEATASLTEQTNQDVPSIDDVREKIERRQAEALATSEVQGATVETKMIEIEQQSVNIEAQRRLEEIKTQMGIATTPATEASADTANENASATATEPATEPTTE